MRRRIPLNAVRAFEATARYKSVAKASDELCVTPTAVSHQIRLLEDFLQTKLFNRRNSRLELTSEAKDCLGKLTEALDLIDDALGNLSAINRPQPRLLVSASASIASLWLMPRMSRFVEQSPEIDVTVSAFVRRRDIEEEESALWICNWQTAADRRVEPLMEEEIVPVCTPDLAARYGSRFSDILQAVPLIHQDRVKHEQTGPYPDWSRYLREAGINRNDLSKGPRFNQASLGIDAAKAGLGALLGRSILIADALRDGKLVQIGDPYPIRSPYYLISPWSPSSPDTVDTFKRWLFGQVQDSISAGRLIPA